MDACIRTIRGIPDHGHFLLGLTVAKMQACAGEGTVVVVVVVNITRFRSDAIIVSRDTVKAALLSQLSASDTMVWLSKKMGVEKEV
jgi:hypothetical protein